MANDPFDFLRKQQEQIRKLMESPALEAAQRQQEQLRKLTESPVLEAMRRQQEQTRKLMESPQFNGLEQQQRQFTEFLASHPIEPLEEYRQSLAEQAIEYAQEGVEEAEPLAETSDANGENAKFFRFRSLQFLLWQMEGLLRALEFSTATGVAVNQVMEEAVVSPAVLAVMLMVVLVGELILWFAKGPPSEES